MKLGKCKQALADLINANGGWVDGEAIFAAMDGNGDLFGYSGRPQWTVSHGHWYGHTLTCWFFSPIVINNHHQTILSCEEYYQAYPKANADGWIEWNGGECPVDGRSLVNYKMRDGGTCEDGDEASDLVWEHRLCWSDIIAYRPHKPEVKPEFCESVRRSIPDPEEKQTIEQLALDYRNKIDYANSKRQEADEAKVAADVALGKLERAGEEIWLLIGIHKDGSVVDYLGWNSWVTGDLVELVNRQGGMAKVGEIGPISNVVGGGDFYVDFPSQSGYLVEHSDVKFIRRP